MRLFHVLNRAFSAPSKENQGPGALPQARIDDPPSAPNTSTGRVSKNWRQLISFGALRTTNTTEGCSVWIQVHYERPLLFIAVIIAFGSIAAMAWDAVRLGRDLSIVSSVLPQKPPVRLHQIVELEEALTRTNTIGPCSAALPPLVT